MKREFSLMAVLLAAALFAALQPFGRGQDLQLQQKPIVENYEKVMVTAPPAELGLDPFYKKYADAFGIPIVSSEKVPDAAVLMARDIVNYMLTKRPDVRATMIDRGARVCIMAQVEMQTDLPEYRDMRKPAKDDPRLTPGERARYDEPGGIGSMTDQEYWNRRARGMGGRITSCAEENLLGYPGTRYYGDRRQHLEIHFSFVCTASLTKLALRCDQSVHSLRILPIAADFPVEFRGVGGCHRISACGRRAGYCASNKYPPVCGARCKPARAENKVSGRMP